MNPFLFQRIRGPVFLLCFALTALLAQWNVLSFARSWPLYLLAAGLLRLLDALFSGRFSRTAYNAQVPTRRGSFSFAVFELIAGVVFLLLTTDRLSLDSFWTVYAVWWPLLLVLLGVGLLGERLLESRTVQAPGYPAQVAYKRRRGGGGLTALVILLVLLGLAGRNGPHFHSGANGEWNYGWLNPDFNFSLNGETHENDITLEHPLAGDGTLTVENARGDIEIAPSADGKIHVAAHQVAHVADRAKAGAFAGARPVLTVRGANGSNATVTVPAHRGVEVSLVLSVPEGVLCTVRNHHGDIAISGLRRALELNQDHGDVTLDSLGGAVHVVMDHGDLHARALGGDLSVNGHAEDLTISDVKGKTTLDGDFLGSISVSGVGGPVVFHSNRTQLEAQRLTGSLSLDSDDLRVTGVGGGLKIDTRSKDVEVSGLSGDAQISDSNSDIHVTASKPLGALSLRNNTGNITLHVPVQAGFSLHGETGKDEEIDSDLALAQGESGGMKTISGQVGQGGPTIDLKTDHGSLTVRHGGLSDAPDVLPVPALTAKPQHERRLRSTEPPPESTVQ